MAPYTFKPLSDHLVLITWTRSPKSEEAFQYIQDLTRLLDEAAAPVYFISDMRRGRIMDLHAIQRLSELVRHPHWAGSTAFTQNPISSMFGANYQRMVPENGERNQIFREPEQAIAYLETLRPGITGALDWDHLLR